MRIRALPDAGAKLLLRFPDHVRELMLELRARVLRVMPSAHEVVSDVGYTISLRYGPDAGLKTSILYITGFSRHANLGFTLGALLKDPAKVLECDGASMRHLKLTTMQQLAEAAWLDGYLII